MSHVVLLGDSIFDNAVYVPEKRSVTDHLRRILPAGTILTLLAIDGSLTAQVAAQFSRLPQDATHLFISSGGNDALMAKYRLVDSASRPEFLRVLESVTASINQFRNEYRRLMGSTEKLNLPTTVCTIYSSVPGLEDMYKTVLSAFNDVIIQEAVARHLPIIELQQVCTDAEDYSAMSPIEPSSAGGEKIARRIALVLRQHNFSSPYSTVY